MSTYRRFAALLGAVAVALPAAGCGGGSSGSGAASDVTLTISRWVGPHADASVQLLKASSSRNTWPQAPRRAR